MLGFSFHSDFYCFWLWIEKKKSVQSIRKFNLREKNEFPLKYDDASRLMGSFKDKIHKWIVSVLEANAKLNLYILNTSLHHLSPLPLRNRIQDLGFILVGGIKQYKKLTHKCVCRPPVKLWQEIDKLPPERLGSTTEFFHYITIDFTGVFTVFENDSPRKSYVLVVADLTTRFISVEVVENMSTAAFIEAFRCYSATRSTP